MGNALRTDALLDRLFAPHGASAYFRRLRDSGSAARRTAAAPAPAGAAPTPAPEGTGAVTDTLAPLVTFVGSDLTVPASGSLLETAESAGLTPRFRCRRGICGTCTTQKVSGTVVDLRTGEASEGPAAIRICVNEARDEVCLDL